jgi:hypothetical protein
MPNYSSVAPVPGYKKAGSFNSDMTANTSFGKMSGGKVNATKNNDFGGGTGKYAKKSGAGQEGSKTKMTGPQTDTAAIKNCGKSGKY